MKLIDLRSDTVTVPTPEMRAAMAGAAVGDDVYGEDPTVKRLEELSAARLGHEAGLFVPSGTMGNLLAALVHCQRGDEVIMGHLGHTFLFEGGGIAALGGIFPHTLPNQPDGTLKLDDVKAAIRPDDIHHPVSRLLILENTHNRCGGVVLSPEYTRQAADLAHGHGLKLHLDGARIFNAAAALNVPVDDLTRLADSVTYCLSKGLCAPVGSVLCGTAAFIQQARRVRKMLGGGMRQVGVLAAAGLIALEQMTTRLIEDHERARRLAAGLAALPGICFELGLPQTNMVFPSLADGVTLSGAEFVARLAAQDILIGLVAPRRFRLVTHYWIDDESVDRTIAAFRANLV